LQRGDEGIVECYGTTESQIVVNFGHVSGQLNMWEVCDPDDMDVASRAQVGPYTVGERVRSLKSMLHWRDPLHRGDEGVIECAGHTDDTVVVKFNQFTNVIKFSQICRPDEFDQTMGRSVGPYQIGDRVQSLRGMYGWNPRPLRRGDTGVIECIGSTERSVVINFGDVSGELCMSDIARVQKSLTDLGASIMALLPDETITEKSAGLCPICLCDMAPDETCCRLPCLHMFHKDCLGEWLARKAQCPVDRRTMRTMLEEQEELESSVEDGTGRPRSDSKGSGIWV